MIKWINKWKKTQSGKNLQRKTVHELNVNTILAYPVCITHPNTYLNRAPAHTHTLTGSGGRKENRQPHVQMKDTHFRCFCVRFNNHRSLFFFFFCFISTHEIRWRCGLAPFRDTIHNAARQSLAHTQFHSFLCSAISFVFRSIAKMRFNFYCRQAEGTNRTEKNK